MSVGFGIRYPVIRFNVKHEVQRKLQLFFMAANMIELKDNRNEMKSKFVVRISHIYFVINCWQPSNPYFRISIESTQSNGCKLPRFIITWFKLKEFSTGILHPNRSL